MELTKQNVAVVDINTIYASLEAFIVQFENGADKFKEAVNNFDFFNSIQTKVLNTTVLNDNPDSDGTSGDVIDEEHFNNDVPMAWFALITKAIFGLYLLGRVSDSVSVTSKEMESANGDKFRMNEVLVPCPRLNYVNYLISSKVDSPNNKLLKIGGIFINGEMAIKAPYDMEEYIHTMVEIDRANGLS